ncbi:MAG: arylsulfatase [Prolixibacteraceae bacterium]|nr:arylsulfatase [Prolixibacteraceae bacterium]MBT6006073.1 arylsulfatase [Prolixibacteraceae bacterium]MBT6997162.1 arylsulfatase [Prolixibacteraceae bacterium]MBT7396677.1 arylsulfatase [Prolixibacteraceae bacterium]
MKTLLTSIGILVALVSCSKPETIIERSKKPNIIYILADDMGVKDLGCYGQQLIKTPNIDKMASEGMRFTQYYAGSTVCAPSRGTLMTGMHTGNGYVKGNFAMENEGNLPLPEKTVTVAELLKSSAYKTGVMGKWGLGGPNDHGHPNNQGFDYSYCYLDQRLAHEYYPDHLWNNFEKVVLNNQYTHDIFAEEALKFISDSKDIPFFLYLPFTIPHGKFQIPDDSPYSNESWTSNQKNYAAMITRMDKDIGRIFSLLDSLELDENTVVFFASDNGGVKGMSDFFGSNESFRGYKTDLYEGGIRAPLIARWPGKITGGTISEHVSAFWDVLPTFCEIAGIHSPENIDGISFLPALLNQNQNEHDFLVWEYFHYNYSWKPGSENARNYLLSQAVRMGNWKGVRNNIKDNQNESIELFDLIKDGGEQNNVAEQFPEIVLKIQQIMESEHKDSEYFKK